MGIFKKLKASILASILLSIILCSCSSNLNKIYGYKKLLQTFEGGEVQASLSGTFVKSKNETIKGNPYNFFIVIELKSHIDGVLLSADFELINSVTKQVILQKNVLPRMPFKKDSDGKYRVYLSEKGLKLDYADYNLKLAFKIKNGDVLINEKMNLELNKKYEEYKSNSFWDRLMSV